jgi:N-ethylmaleimide reductase
MTIDALFSPIQMGAVNAPHRVFMAPLTRMRSTPSGVPLPLASIYYAQRADAGLIIGEGTSIGLHAEGFPCMPGLYTPEQVAGWRQITDAVHAAGGRIAAQIVHHGRTSHSSYGAQPVGPSAISAGSVVYSPSFTPEAHEVPHALSTGEIGLIVRQFARAANLAIDAGFDAVEIHGANGYLVDQFLQDGSNQRTDEYGGSVEHRTRFLLEVVDAVSGVIGSERTGVRLSPFGAFNGVRDSDPASLFSHAIAKLDTRNIAWLHLIEPRASTIGLADDVHENGTGNAVLFRQHFRGSLIAAGGFTAQSGANLVREGFADAIAFGRSFLANPDLPKRFRAGSPLNAYDRTTFYGGGDVGYTDYPTLA